MGVRNRMFVFTLIVTGLVSGTACSEDSADQAGDSASEAVVPGPDAGEVAGIDLPPVPGTFRFAILSDTHIIDEFYEGPEGSVLDTASIFGTPRTSWRHGTPWPPCRTGPTSSWWPVTCSTTIPRPTRRSTTRT